MYFIDVTPLQDDKDKEIEYCEAILARLRFKKVRKLQKLFISF